MAQNLKLRKKQKYFKNQKIKYFEKKRKLYLKNYFSLHIKKKNKKPINYLSFLKHWESEKIIYIQESHFLRLQTFFKNKLNLILNTEQCLIKHYLYPKVYYCNETQFLSYLKSNLILETYLSNNYLKYMKKYLKDYNKRQVVLKQPKIIGIFKTTNNITLFVRSDVSFLEKFNKRSYRFKAKMIFYFYLQKKLKKLVILKKVFKKLSIKKSFIRIQNSFRLKESGKNMFRIRFKPKQCFINRLDQIYGLDKHKYFFLSKMFGFSKNYYLKPKSLTLMLKVEKYLHKTSAKRNIGFAYKKKYDSRVKQVRKSSLYRGTRHRSNLSVRGQRTRTNARTQKRKKKTENFSFKNNIKVLKKKVIKKNDSKKKKK